MSTLAFYFVVRKHNSWSGKNKSRKFSESEYDRALAHYGRLKINGNIDKASLCLRCGLTQPFDEIILEAHWK